MLNPFRRTDPAGCSFVTNAAERVKMVSSFSREECLAASTLNGLTQPVIMAIESRLRRLAGTFRERTWTRAASDLSTRPNSVRARQTNARRRASSSTR